MRLLYLLLLCCPMMPYGLHAEDISGIWKGTLTQGPGGCYPHYYLELQINITNDQITGKAYDYFDKEHFVKMSFTGRYNAQTHRLVLIEEHILQQSIPAECSACIKTYDLNYSKEGGEEILRGDWKGIMQERRLTRVRRQRDAYYINPNDELCPQNASADSNSTVPDELHHRLSDSPANAFNLAEYLRSSPDDPAFQVRSFWPSNIVFALTLSRISFPN